MTTTDTATTVTSGSALEIAPETFVIQALYREPGAPVAVHMNSMVIRGEEPVIIDTGAPIHRAQFLETVFSLVEPNDVRWLFLSHDDGDHIGSLHEVMELCSNATLVANWFFCERLGAERLDVPPFRWRWVNDGESFDAGDRTLVAVRPPLFDSPTTRGLFDPTTGVYWAADCYATPVMEATPYVDELDPGAYAEGFAMFQTWNSPWVSIADERAFGATCKRVEDLAPTAIASCHGPTVRGADVQRAFELTRTLPTAAVPPQPGQPVLDQIIASMPH